MGQRITAILFCLALSCAKGDGTTKNTTAIQKAIDACTKAGGGRVVLMDGIYGYPVKVDINPDAGTKVEAVRNLHFSNVHATGKHFPFFHGREANPLQNFTFDNCSFVREAAPDQKEPELF